MSFSLAQGRTALLALLPLLHVSVGCSSSVDAGSETAFPPLALDQHLPTSCDQLNVEIRTAPSQPPTTGLDGVELVVTDSSNKIPVDGLTVDLVPWMPLMGHGADLTPTTSAKGQGRYVITNVSLFMPGEWQLRFQIAGDKLPAGGCRAAPTYNVP
jgi:hypothetical protein